MKERKHILAVLFLTLCASSCHHEAIVPNTEKTVRSTLTFRMVEAPGQGDTKTGFGALQGNRLPVLWDNTDVVGVTEAFAEDYTSAIIVPSESGRTGTFSVTLDAPSEGPFSIQTTYPASRIVSFNPTTSDITLNIPASQAPTATGPDPASILLVANQVIDAIPGADEDILLPFHHATAYGCLTLTNLPTDAEIRSIDLIFSVPVSGKWKHRPEDRSMASDIPSHVITIQTNKPEQNYFACAPVDLAGQTVLVRLNTTTDGMYETTVSFAEGKKLSAGVLCNMVVDMAGSTRKDFISVFTIGNSYSNDAYAYLNEILAAAGFTYDTYNIYISGCSLQQHVETYNNGDYRYRLLQKRDWDYVVLHQVYTVSGVAESYDPYLWELIDIVRSLCPKAKLIWYPSWACQQNSTYVDFKKYYNGDQMTMYNAIQDVTQNLVLPTGAFGDMIPATSLVQNLRTSPLGDTICRDIYSHLSYKIGRYAVGLGWCRVLTCAPVSGITYTPPPSAYGSTEGYTQEELSYIHDAVEKAYWAPFAITPYVAPDPGPDPGPGPDPDPDPDPDPPAGDGSTSAENFTWDD